ncbi:MAG: PQQ-dependent sugar dehydrogenase [Geminicoccaceae bacterium]
MSPLHVFALICALGVVVGGSALATVLFIHFKIWPYEILGETRYGHLLAPRELSWYSNEPAYRQGEPVTLQTKFLDLQIDAFNRADPQQALDGSLASYDQDHVLMVESEGRFFLLDVATLDEKRLDIDPPAFGLEQPIAASKPDDLHITNRLHRITDVNLRGDTIYLAYSYFNADDACFTKRVARVTLPGAIWDVRIAAEDWQVVAETEPCLPFTDHPVHPYAGHFSGGRMAIAADGTVFLAVGFFGYDKLTAYDAAQDADGHYGKVLRIDPASGAIEVLTLGHRNPRGIAFTDDGRFWLTEHGPDGGDELNLLKEGNNYGWAVVTFGTEYGERNLPFNPYPGDHAGYTKPIFSWVPSIATSGLVVARDLHPYWDDDLLVPTLKDRALHRIVVEDDRVVTTERIVIGERISAAIVHNGHIILFCRSGNMLRITPQTPAQSPHLASIVAQLSPETQAVLKRCSMCHSRGHSETAPNLCGVEGRRVASDSYAEYSVAIRSVGGIWDRARLDRFLLNTTSVYANGAMPDQSISNATVRREILDNLAYFCP